MHKNIIRAAATATALLVAGCSAPDNAAETVTTAPAAETVTAPVVPTAQDGYAWVGELLYQADMEWDSSVLLAFTNDANCGAAISPAGAGGCTLTLEDGTYLVTISPAIIGTDSGKHIFFHELAHTWGAGECEAEHYAAQFDEMEIWSYPECAPMADDAA